MFHEIQFFKFINSLNFFSERSLATNFGDLALDTSLDTKQIPDELPGTSKNEKLFVSLTVFTTTTSTLYVLNTATTVVVSYECIPQGGTGLACV